jgi:hypothetical protein
MSQYGPLEQGHEEEEKYSSADESDFDPHLEEYAFEDLDLFNKDEEAESITFNGASALECEDDLNNDADGDSGGDSDAEDEEVD